LNDSASPAVARLLRDDTPVGGGALLPDGTVLTCAHVVISALELPSGSTSRPSDLVTLDLPLQGIPPLQAEVVAWCPPGGFGEGDIALLRLVDPEAVGAAALVLTPRAVATDERLSLFGFPQGRPQGVWAGDLRLTGMLVGSWQQVIPAGAHAYKLQAGFSGCPLIDADGAVIGMFAQADRDKDADVGAEIPVEIAADLLQVSSAVELPLARPKAPAGSDTRAHSPSVWNVPAWRNPNFTGREEEIAALADALENDRVVALTGLGGLGKSQLAVQWAHATASDYEIVWWVAADQRATLIADMAALATQLALPEAESRDEPAAATAARRWLEQHGSWLLVYDNAPSPRAIGEWIPRTAAGHVVITSRHPSWGGIARRTMLRPLPREAAAELLARRSGQSTTAATHKLTERLGGLPLALEQAGAYMETRGVSIDEYLRLFEKHEETLLEYAGDTEVRSVATTWELAFRQLHEDSPAGAALLTVAAFLAPDDIPRSLFVDNELPEPLRLLHEPLSFAEAVAALIRYSLITPTGDGFSTHRLVQVVTRIRLTESEREAWAGTAVDLLRAAVSFGRADTSTWAPTGRLIPHCLQSCAHAERHGAAPATTISLLNTVGLYQRERAQFNEARSAHERAIVIAETALGQDHPSVAASLFNLSSVLMDLAELDQAQSAVERAIAIDEAEYGPNHPEIAMDLNNLGQVLHRRGHVQAARTTFERVLAIYEEAGRSDDPVVATFVNNLGGVLLSENELEAAKAAFERALAIDQASHGAVHPNVAVRVTNLGEIAMRQGDLDAARKGFESALAIDQAVYGHDHPEVATDLHNLAQVLQRLNELKAARTAIERAVRIDKATYGGHHPRVGLRLRSLGAILQDLGQLEAAEDAYKRALEVASQAFGPTDSRTQELATALMHVRNARAKTAG
jgi:tetratricopeptide (TPR) repeat protein